MTQLTDHELERKKLLKAVRAMVRLKYALMADEELNRVLPQIAGDFDRAIAAGKPYELAVQSLLSSVDED